MWEIALLIIAVAFLILVIFTIPALLQLRDSAKELEFTLREAKETLRRLREISVKAEGVIDRGRTVVDGAGRAFVALDGILGKSGTRFISRILTTALEIFPVALTAGKLIAKFRRRKDHV